ncbi:phage tail spike protein [Streptococcus suis]|uniref:phage tail spike protein n=1 Tax=Streptococcus suis TaxID=1307 RepID=UPI002AB3F7EB|nr:phage tail spike protein [Streptococcus suis]MDY7591307.1 phage tail spike protein [Streptococcus suis]
MIYLKDGNIPLNLAYDDDIVQEANSTYQLSFKFPLTDGKWNLLKREVFLLADDLHGEQEFFIFEVKKVNSHVQVYAKQVATLLNYYSINSISVDRVPGQTVMTALAGSVKRPCPFTFFSDILDRHTFNESNVSVMDALAKDKHSVIGQWGGDLVRDKYQVKLLKNGGTENESLFMYKKNLSSYEESENINNLKTRLHLKKIIQGQSEGEEDRVIVVTVDSPLISQYSQIYEADIEVNDQDVTDEASLLAYGQRYFGSTLCDLVENSINLDVKGKSDVSVKMFDTVSVFHERFDVDLRLKITSYHFGPMSKRLKSIGFGKVSQSFGSTVASMVAGSIDKATGRLSASFEQKLQKEIDNANRHFDAEFEKRVEEINDGIEQAQAEAERYADAIKQEIDTEIAQVNQSMQAQSEEHDRQVADILAKTQSVESLANQAKTDAASAIAQALQFENEAIAEATRLDTVERQATETKLATAKSQVISEATRLVETAKSLLSGQIANVSTDLSQTKEAIKLLATKATVDTLTGRVSSAEAMIQVQADQISQRVKTSDFDQAKQRISTAESSITQLGNRITTEISETVAKIPKELGIRNLIKGTKDLSGNNPNQNTSDTYLGFNIARSRPSSGYVDTFRVATTINATATAYVTTFYARSDVDGFLIDCHLFSPDTTTSAESSTGHKTKAKDGLVNVRLTTEWKRYWVKWTQTPVNEIKKLIVGRNRVERGNATVEIAGVALYEGDMPKDWSPAPEDAVTEIENVKTIITQTAEGQQQLSTRLIEAQGKTTTAETNIRQLISDVSSKVSQTDYNTLTGRVDSAETAITQNATEISKRLTKTQVDKAITDKGYQTKSDVDSNITGRGYITNSALQPYALSTTVQTLVKETADSFSRTISETKALIPSYVGTRNLLKGTKDLSGNDAKNFNTSDKYLDFNIARSRPTTGYSDTFSAYTTIPVTANDYIISFYAKSDVDGATLYCHFYNPNTTTKAESSTGYKGGSPDGLARVQVTTEWQRYWVKWSQSKTDTVKKVIIGRNNSADGIKIIEVAGVALYEGALNKGHFDAPEDLATVTALHNVKDTVSSHTRTIGAVGETGSILDNVSKVTQTAAGLVAEVSGTNGLKTQVSTLAGSYAIKNLTKAGDVLSQINLNSDGSVRINEGLISVGTKTYIQDGVITSAKIAGLDAGKITSGYLASGRIKAGSIDGSKIAFDEAFFNGLVANQAYLKKLFAKDAFLTAVQAVAVSAKQITGGIAEALNGGMDVNFDESKINFYTNVAAIRRIYTGHPTQFIKFETEGNYSRTIIGSNRNGGEVFNSATFAGIVVENTNNINTEDNVRIYGDNTLLRHAQGDVGWNINSVTQRIVPANMNAESEIWSKHFVAPDKNSKPVRLDTAVAALWDIWNHIIYNNFEFNAALRTHIKARRDNWKFELNL